MKHGLIVYESMRNMDSYQTWPDILIYYKKLVAFQRHAINTQKIILSWCNKIIYIIYIYIQLYIYLIFIKCWQSH